MDIYLIRHTAVYNPQKLCYGQSDIPLTAGWETAFELLKNKLGEIKGDSMFYSSPFKRCTQLAAFLSENNYLIDERISEMHFGHWEQQEWATIDKIELNKWMAGYVTCQVPGGESFEDLYERCVGFWEALLLQGKQNTFLITHAGVIRAILAYLLKIPLDKVFQMDIDYSSVTRITVNEQQGNYVKIGYVNR